MPNPFLERARAETARGELDPSAWSKALRAAGDARDDARACYVPIRAADLRAGAILAAFHHSFSRVAGRL